MSHGTRRSQPVALVEIKSPKPDDLDFEEEAAWNARLDKIDEQTPMFDRRLPTKQEEADQVAKQTTESSVWPLVLAQEIKRKRFFQWLRTHELGMHQAIFVEETVCLRMVTSLLFFVKLVVLMTMGVAQEEVSVQMGFIWCSGAVP